MGTRVLTGNRGRWLAVAGSVAVSSVVIFAQSVGPANEHRDIAGQGHAGTGSTVPSGPAGSPAYASAPGPSLTEADLLAASTPIEPRVLDFPLAKGVAPESGLQVKTIWVARAISMMFPEITTIGGYRQDPLRWHPNGLAIDVMIPNYHSDQGIELGNQIAGLALANAERWGVIHVIWRQGFYPGIGAPSWTADYGSETLNHFDHVHIATDGGGYPTGGESYYLGSMTPR